MKHLKNQMGRTMVEMLAVLAIIGVLTVGAIAGLSQAIDKYRTSKLHDDILSIDSGIVDLYAWQRRYPDSTASSFMYTLCTNNIFPEGCIGNSVAKNVYGGQYIVETTSQTVTIKATGLPANICINLASDDMDWGEFLAPGENNPVCNAGTFEIIFN